jgi:cell division protein ZipA
MDLRWGLLLVGLVLLGLIYIYSRYRPEIESFFAAISRPRVPMTKVVNDGGDALPSADKKRVDPVLAESTGQEEDEEPGISEEAEPDVPPKIVAIRMMSREREGFAAEKLLLALRDAGLRHGEFGIFHRPDVGDENRSYFSVASLLEPGSFDLTRVKTECYPGVSIFLRLPGPDNGIDAFDEMLETSRSLAAKLDGELLDEQGSTLSIQRQRYLREEVIQFEHHVK